MLDTKKKRLNFDLNISLLLHHENAPGYTSDSATIFTRLDPMRLYSVLKTENTYEGEELDHYLGDHRKKRSSYQKEHIRSGSWIRKCVATSVSFLRGSTTKWRN